MKGKLESNPTKTVLTISTGFLILFLILNYKGMQVNWLLYFTAFLGVIGIFSSYLSKRIEWLWMKLAWVLSFIIPNIILTLVFYLFLFPLSLLSRVFRKKDSLNLKNKLDTTFVETEEEITIASFEKPW